MRKIEGLKFLQKHFPDLTVDCLFVDRVENLDESALYQSNQIYKKEQKTVPTEQIWRVRGGRKIGSELNLPQGTFKTPKELKKFMKEQKQRDSNIEFVIHRVSPEYFAAPFVGTLAVYNNYNKQGITIEVQKVTKELVDSIDKGKRPRDWEACLILDYEFLSKSPKVLKKSSELNMDFLKYPIVVIHEIGEEIFRLYEENGQEAETYTRFNIYNLGQVVLDDHRSKESFIQKYKFAPNSKSQMQTQMKNSKNQDVTQMAQEKEL